MLFLSSGGPGGLHGNMDSCESVSGVQKSTHTERVVNMKRTETDQREREGTGDEHTGHRK